VVTSVKGKTSACQKGGWKRNLPLALTGEFLDPVKARRREKFYLVLVTLWSPDSSTREHRDKEVTT
jgi:hypothetical protein